MSSGPRGEEPIDLDLNRRLHYLRLLRLHGCRPRCARCREAQGILIAAGVPINPDTDPEPVRRDPFDRTWEPFEILLAVLLLVFAFACTVLTGGRR